jgi:hypothetical protein
MKRNERNYNVISHATDADGMVTNFKVNINGAEFTINRVYNKFEPTSMFKFLDKISYDENSNPVEIDWSTSIGGLYRLAADMGLRLVPGASHYAVGGSISYFIDDHHFQTNEEIAIEEAENCYIPYDGDDF